MLVNKKKKKKKKINLLGEPKSLEIHLSLPSLWSFSPSFSAEETN